MEINATNRPIVVFKLIEQTLRSVVEQVDASIVERRKDPRTILVERQALYSLALGFKLGLHHG